MALQGVDVSHHNGDIDWGKVAAVGRRRFAIMKSSQGIGYRDTTFATNTDAARKAGLLVGSYHFAEGAPPDVEAVNYVAAIKAVRKPGDITVLDLEGGALARPDAPVWAAAWIAAVRAALEVTPMLYVQASALTRNWSPVIALGAKLWVAAYRPAVPAPGRWPAVTAWQYTSSGGVAGISGRVDMNLFYGTTTDWAVIGGLRVPAAPKPAPPAARPATAYTPPPGRWALPAGHYYGLITGPARSHGGFHAAERPAVRWIQTRLQQLGYAPKTAGWADGKFEQPTKDAVARWQKARHARTTSRPGEVWSDDWANLIKDR